MPMSVTNTIAAPRGTHRANDSTKGIAITAAVAAAPSNTKTCSARSTTSTPASVASTKQPSSANPRADTTTEYSRSRGVSASLDKGAVTGPVYPTPRKLTRTGEVRPARSRNDARDDGHDNSGHNRRYGRDSGNAGELIAQRECEQLIRRSAVGRSLLALDRRGANRLPLPGPE